MSQTTPVIDSVIIRMYRAGTGDFFILKFLCGTTVSFKLMIDCGCIQGSKAIFAPLVDDLRTFTQNEIDLLVVTHEHADHINGFQIAAAELSQINFDKVWFAWTEDRKDATANDYRQRYTRMKMALSAATSKLVGLKEDGYYIQHYALEATGAEQLASQEHFIGAITELDALNLPVNGAVNNPPTMVDLLTGWKIIKEDTIVEYLSPGELRQQIKGLPGINIFVLGPPRDLNYLSSEEKSSENYQKRAKRSTLELSMVNALAPSAGGYGSAAFDPAYELTDPVVPIKTTYAAEDWRNIDHDWLLGAGSLGLKLQQCINNTSLALAFQFQATEEVLLFPGDAELGNWQSWHDQLKWQLTYNGKTKTVDAEYLLNHTVFYKVSHHLSQNGTPTTKGLAMMTHPELVAMATLDLKKIMSGWMNTMPNDLLSAALISKTKGQLYFVGQREGILKNIETERVNLCQADLDLVDAVNKNFDGKGFIEYQVKATVG